jgi:magnesium-transporting ATPase (P-type)
MPAWRQLLAQVVSFFALMLWVAGALAFVAGMPQLGVAIFVVVGINAAFAFVQEHRAERAAQRLRDLLPRRARVIRNGQWLDIDASELVVGDLVALEGGDRVSADLDVLWARSLMLDTSTLTGEAVPWRWPKAIARTLARSSPKARPGRRSRRPGRGRGWPASRACRSERRGLRVR